jgi:hypothetical protein
MHKMGIECALTLSILAGGYRLEWDEAMGPPAPCLFQNAKSAFTVPEFDSATIAERVSLGTMTPFAREHLLCILPLGVAYNSAGKMRLIWDGSHVNQHLPHELFHMNSLQREGWALFESARFSDSADILSVYHHIPMHPDSTCFLEFEWGGQLYRFLVLPFGLSTAPRIFSTVMGHTVCFL